MIKRKINRKKLHILRSFEGKTTEQIAHARAHTNYQLSTRFSLNIRTKKNNNSYIFIAFTLRRRVEPL